MEKESITAVKSFNFAVDTLNLCKLLRYKKEFILSDQLLRSGTSIGANIEEARAAQSRKDFISKMSIASKEARETRYWLRLIKQSKVINNDLDEYINNVNVIIRLLIASVKTATKSLNT